MTRLIAEDVVATYWSILDPATASPHSALLGIIAEVRADGPDRVEFRLREPDPLFPAYLGIGILAPAPSWPPPPAMVRGTRCA